jgi:beta-glucosidase
MHKLLTIFVGTSLAIITPGVMAGQYGADPYKAYQQQAQTIYESLTLDEKVGQLLLPSLKLLATSVPQPNNQPAGSLCESALNANASNQAIITACGFDQLATYHIGNVFVDGGPFYNAPTLQNWQLLTTLAKQAHSPNKKDPLLLLGTDAVHGNSHNAGAVIFPHNINLGATHDAKLVKQIAELTAQDVLFSGFNWLYAPTVALADDIRWGRTYESFGQDPQLIGRFAKEYTKSVQNQGALVTVKHFFADGATQYGFDEGNVVTHLNEAQLWQRHGQGYETATQAGAGSLMVSYSSINGDPMHFGGPWNSINRFKHGELGKQAFNGLVVSDYNAASRAAYIYNSEHPDAPPIDFISALAKTVNAGVDMLMLGLFDRVNPFGANSPNNYTSVAEVHRDLKQAINQGLISQERLQEAVTRILAVKLFMTQQSMPLNNYEKLQQQERNVALQAASQSLVLLKNKNAVLPIKTHKVKNVVLLGDVDDIGIQNGGWTINWQGQKGNQYFSDTAEGKFAQSSGATTLAQGLKNRLPQDVQYFNETNVHEQLENLKPKQTVAILILSEPPYAEYMGDIGNHHTIDPWYAAGAPNGENSYMPLVQKTSLAITPSADQLRTVQALRDKGIPVITVLYSGRPMVITETAGAPLPLSDAFIAAFLPGTLGGQAIADAITGNYHFRSKAYGQSNTLSFPWPRNDKDVATNFKSGELFPIGYGLATGN